MINAKIILDAISPKGNRITTFELEYPRYIHSELKTHRVFSTNSASSRAIPLNKMIELVQTNKVYPHWTLNQKGMTGIEVDSDLIKETANTIWDSARNNAIEAVRQLQCLGIHKQNANRLLEPFQHIKTILTGTEFDNFFKLRIAPEAQPEMCELALKMKDALEDSSPVKLDYEQVYAPYKGILDKSDGINILTSVALCAQVSYRKEDEDLHTVERVITNLIGHAQIHASPFEHVVKVGEFKGNLTSFTQLRHAIEYWKEIVYKHLSVNERDKGIFQNLLDSFNEDNPSGLLW